MLTGKVGITSERKYIASFFTSKQTTIDYYKEGDNYYFKYGVIEGIRSLSQGDIEQTKVEIAQIIKVDGIERVKQINKRRLNMAGSDHYADRTNIILNRGK